MLLPAALPVVAALGLQIAVVAELKQEAYHSVRLILWLFPTTAVNAGRHRIGAASRVRRSRKGSHLTHLVLVVMPVVLWTLRAIDAHHTLPACQMQQQRRLRGVRV